MEDPLWQLLLEGMLLHLVLIDRDAQAGTRVGMHESSVALDDESLVHDILPPRYV